MPDILMKCGCRANATDGNRPCCAVHAGLTPLAYEIAETPNLEGRMARCYCGKEEPSSLSLAFFEYRGVGSLESVESCKHCHMHKEAHVRDPKIYDDYPRRIVAYTEDDLVAGQYNHDAIRLTSTNYQDDDGVRHYKFLEMDTAISRLVLYRDNNDHIDYSTYSDRKIYEDFKSIYDALDEVEKIAKGVE